MIREFKQSDIDSIIDIWLNASIKAHDFIKKDFWESKTNEMRKDLNLTVYKANAKSIKFYIGCGFKIIKEQTDENTGCLELLMKYNS